MTLLFEIPFVEPEHHAGPHDANEDLDPRAAPDDRARDVEDEDYSASSKEPPAKCFASRLNKVSTKIAICHKTRPSRALRVPLAISASVLTY